MVSTSPSLSLLRIPAIIIVAAAVAVTVVWASANGLLYICDTTKLSSENLCYFVASSTNTVGATAHSINVAVAADGFRVVKDSSSNTLTVTPKPWTQGDVLAATTTQQTGDNLNYVKAFEMIAPLRDMMMYTPTTLTTSTTEWNKWVKPMVDCQIKDTTETVSGHTAYSVTDIYALMKNPSNTDIHHGVLQFLEEGAIDLVCVMCPGLVMDRCTTMRTKLGLSSGQTSTCWEAGFNAIYTTSTSAPATPAPPTPAPNTPAPSTATSAPSTPTPATSAPGTPTPTTGGATSAPGTPAPPTSATTSSPSTPSPASGTTGAPSTSASTPQPVAATTTAAAASTTGPSTTATRPSSPPPVTTSTPSAPTATTASPSSFSTTTDGGAAGTGLAASGIPFSALLYTLLAALLLALF